MALTLAVAVSVVCGGLGLEARSIHLMPDTDGALAQMQSWPVQDRTVSRDALKAELAQLVAQKPSLVGPVLLLTGGGLLVFGGAVASFFGLLLGVLIGSPWLIVIGLPVVAVGSGLLIAGSAIQSERSTADMKIERAQRRLNQLEDEDPRPGPTPVVHGPQPGLVVAAF